MEAQDDIAGKIAAAFRLVGEDPDFRESADRVDGRFLFEVVEQGIRGVVKVENGTVRWTSGSPDRPPELSFHWRSWEDLRKWVNGIAPIWWYRFLGRLRMEGKLEPVFQETVYLFRNILRRILEDG